MFHSLLYYFSTIDVCLSLSQDNNISNARLRRRLKRITESIETRDSLVQRVQDKQLPTSELGVPQQGKRASSNTLKSTDAGSNGRKQGVLITHSVDMADATRLLMAENLSTWDIEQVLNNLSLPEKSESHAPEFLTHRAALAKALNRAMGVDAVRGILKRRLQRLQFVLADDSVKAEIKAKSAAAAAASAAQSRGALRTPCDTTGVSALPPARSLQDALKAMQNVRNSEELEAALLGVNERSRGSLECRTALVTAVELALGNTALVSNAKDRRRVKRALDALQNPEAEPAPAGLSSSAASSQSKIAAAKSAGGTSDAVPVSLTSLVEDLRVAIGSSDSTALEAALVRATAALANTVSRDSAAVVALKTLFKEISATGPTAPVRRRAQRALQNLELENVDNAEKGAISASSKPQLASAVPPKSVVAAINPVPSTVVLHNPPSGPPLDAAIAAVRAAATAAELEEAISTVRAGHGNMRSRRALRRAIAAALSGGAGDSDETDMGSKSRIAAEMNSKQRRSVSRVLNVLEGKPDSGVREVPANELHALVGPERAQALLGAKSSVTEATKESDAVAGAKRKRIATTPYVVFVGQLPFKTTAEELTKHLQVNGVDTRAEGYQVRLLTAPGQSDRSRGSAFVQLPSAEQLHRCLSLHHSVLQGRRINVEKSCGGSDKGVRAARLEEQRRVQQEAVRAKIDTVLKDFESRDVLVVSELGALLQERLYACTAAHVSDLLEEYAARPREKRSRKDLDQLIDLWESKRYKKGVNFQLQGMGHESDEEEQGLREM